MAKCNCCGSDKASYPHYDGGYICEACVGHYFSCPGCGRVFEQDDYEHGDAGNGYCSECAPNY